MMKELKVPAIISSVDAVTDFINAELEANDCLIKAQMQIDIAIDEVFSNIANYAYKGTNGDATITVDVDDSFAIISFADSGVEFNPLSKDDPNTNLSAEDREIGGLGIFLVKKSMDEVLYEYKNNMNILTLKKKIK